MTPALLAIFALGVGIVITVAAFVAAPLWAGSEQLAELDEADERERWERQKRQALVAIRETELDHQMGKLSDEDLERMRGRFEQQALEAIDALEHAESRR
jgi:hypothetical protein